MERSTRGRRLLVWDAPNMDMCLSEVIGERASAATRSSSTSRKPTLRRALLRRIALRRIPLR